MQDASNTGCATHHLLALEAGPVSPHGGQPAAAGLAAAQQGLGAAHAQC